MYPFDVKYEEEKNRPKKTVRKPIVININYIILLTKRLVHI